MNLEKCSEIVKVIVTLVKHLFHSFRIFVKCLFKSTTTQMCSQLQHCYSVGVNMPMHYRQLRVKDLLKVPVQRIECDSNLRLSGRKAPNLSLSHHVPMWKVLVMIS